MVKEEVQQVPTKVNLEQFDVKVFSKDKIRELYRSGKLPTAEAFVDEIILRGVKLGANDIHFEPSENELRIRVGLEGVLKKLVFLPKDITENIINVLKTKGSMNTFEKKKPQDGRFSITINGHQFDLRVSSIPTMFGERIALRLLHKTARIVRIEEIGFLNDNLRKFITLLHRPRGLILITGPSGSGKSTTMYAGINAIQSEEKNILTVENPIEYKLDFASQISPPGDQSFSSIDALRAIMRHNPNVIMIGEIRDADTALVAAEAALTGTLVVSTMLSGDAIGTIPRLLSLGVSPYWLATTLIGIVYQVLVRRICDSCKEENSKTDERNQAIIEEYFGVKTFYNSKGCNDCDNTGYRGRISLHEVLLVNDNLKDLVYQQASTLKLREAALASGFDDIYKDAARKISAGITSPAECLRVLG